MERVRAAVVQFCAGPDKADNIARMEPLVERAAAAGADLVQLPEKWNGTADGPDLRRYAERLDEGGETIDAMRSWAARLGICLIGGSVAIDEGDERGVGNVSLAFDETGELRGAYTKIHLFDVEVGGLVYRESDGTLPGDRPVVCDLAGVRVGLTVCYDLRFPELYRALAGAGAAVLSIPANFTLLTGMAHWEVLQRARAIENAAYVLAAGQHGNAGGGSRPSYGHSMIVDPWGTVIAEAPEGDGIAVADLDLAYRDSVMQRIPALRHRRPELYREPAPVAAH
jgi:deaminated glutathione amidase